MAQSTGPALFLVPQHLRVEPNFQAEEFGEGEQPPSWLPPPPTPGFLSPSLPTTSVIFFSSERAFVTNFSVAKGGFLKIASLISCFGIKKQ